MTCSLVPSATCNAGPLGPSLVDVCPGQTFFAFMSILNSMILRKDKISGRCERVKPVKKLDEKYDFIVIGGGAAGSVVAARLSEIPDWKVLLLEAGPDEPAGAQIPGFNSMFLKTNIIWNYTTTNESYACQSTNGSCAWPSGKNLGGNTVHNVMVYLRGNPTDYNNWAADGNEGWTWGEVEKFFIKNEDNGEIDRVGRKHHGTGGPQSVERFSYVSELGISFLAAAEEIGYGVSDDFNGEKITGYSNMQAMQKNGVRHSSARSYLWPARNRKNLHVSLESHVTRLIIENDRVVGVEYHKDGKQRRVYATREVILSAGTVGSPHILLLSGIGPREHLESMGVGVVKNLPGVGENLHDHPTSGITFTINEADTYDNDWKIAKEYVAFQTGPLSGIGTQPVVGVLASSKTTPNFPDIESYIYSYVTTCATGRVGALATKGKRIVILQPVCLHPKSRGRITLASKDPFKLPVIWANYLADPQDIDVIVEGLKMAVAMLDTEALRPYNFTLSNASLEACSGLAFKSNEWWVCVVRQTTSTGYHQVGTCKMGPSSDPMAVVDPRLRLYGIKGLRVADNSIMPQISSGNTAAPAMMIGERAADFIKEDWGRKFDQNTCSFSKFE